MARAAVARAPQEDTGSHVARDAALLDDLKRKGHQNHHQHDATDAAIGHKHAGHEDNQDAGEHTGVLLFALKQS